MTEPPAESFDAARARMREQAAESRRRNEALRAVADAVETATASAKSPDGSITVTAATTGAILGINLAESALESDASELAALLVKTIASAQRAALERAAQLSADHLGASNPLVAELSQSAQRFGGPDAPLNYR